MTQAMRLRRPVWYIYGLYLTGLLGLAFAVAVSTAPAGPVQTQIRVIRTAEALYCPRPDSGTWNCTYPGRPGGGPHGPSGP